MPTSFKKSLGISLGIHLVALILIYYSPDFARILPEKKNKITWIKLSKGDGQQSSKSPFKKSPNLPKSTIREQEETLKQQDQKGSDAESIISRYQGQFKKKPVVPTPKEEAGIKPKPKTEEEILMDEAIAKIQERLEAREIEIAAAQVEDGGGQSPYGVLDAAKTETDPVLIEYYETLKHKIHREWITIPKTESEEKNPVCRINVDVDGDGSLRSVNFALHSADPSFDASAKRAIERATPFPPPPASIKTEVIREGFLIEFNPTSVVRK